MAEHFLEAICGTDRLGCIQAGFERPGLRSEFQPLARGGRGQVVGVADGVVERDVVPTNAAARVGADRTQLSANHEVFLLPGELLLDAAFPPLRMSKIGAVEAVA